jgi:predicted ATP-dependent endonuclease of OLD family
MHIKFVEIQNFRKLKSVRIDFSKKTTLLVGANNSGKTSATLALRNFLVEPEKFTTNDFTLSNWAVIETIAIGWETQAAAENAAVPTLETWESALPSLDVWLEVDAGEIHYVRRLIPTLDWAGGALGVRLRFEPRVIEELYKDYHIERKAAQDTKAAGAAGENGRDFKLRLWPENMRSFLERRLRTHFTVRTYLLDGNARVDPTNGIAKPQLLPNGIGPVEGNPLGELICVNAIAAQRGLGEPSDPAGDGEGDAVTAGRRPLSEQLRSYYTKHLDPSVAPEPADLEALEAIEQSQQVFDKRLAYGFANPIRELENLNYPGVADPKLTIATWLRPTDGLKHNAAVQYELASVGEGSLTSPLRLPEEYNGLGYQNLISIVFRLMAFRDAWMRVGKAARVSALQPANKAPRPPLHLVLVEEPEAHLHPQVQQVFVRQAYDILRNHADLKADTGPQTQLVVSTHSSHVAHECPFSSLRYFRRLASADGGGIPTSAVVNLSEVFGPEDETKDFVTRYIRATHCDLFFADGAILVEGDAERILVPHFISEHFIKLHRCYVTLMQVGGSHAHRLKPLIEHLGLTTLIVTDIDTGEAVGRHKWALPERACGQVTNNATLKKWHPEKNLFDDLVDLPDAAKVKTYGFPQFLVRLAYQIPVSIQLDATMAGTEALPSTFEDALALENIELFKTIDDGELGELATAFKEIITAQPNPADLAKKIAAAVRNAKSNAKAEFALDLLTIKEDMKKLNTPRYIADGLNWLETQLDQNRRLLLQAAGTTASTPLGSAETDAPAPSPESAA